MRVTMSGAAGVDDGQVEHVIVDSARAVSWRAIGWVSMFIFVMFLYGLGSSRGRYQRGGPRGWRVSWLRFVDLGCWLFRGFGDVVESRVHREFVVRGLLM